MRLLLLTLVLATLVGCSDGEATAPRPTATVAVTTPVPTTIPEDAPAPSLSAPTVVAESMTVAPPPDSPLALVRRDCGMSVPLPAGGSLWLYCDTAVFRDDDRPAWFANSSAAFASEVDPRTMHEPTDVRGRVRPFLTPDATYPTCDPGAGRFTWPTAAVPVDDDDGPTIAVFYENVCVESPEMRGADIGVAEFEPPEEAVPDEGFEQGGPSGWIQAEIVEARLFPRAEADPAFGQAAVRSGDHVFAYRCPDADEACTVARTRADLVEVADPTSWGAWDGAGWAAPLDAGEPMVMPDPVRLVKPSVGWLADAGVFVLAGHRYDNTGVVQLRVARQPWGPWSPPSEVTLPGCQAAFPNICFAVEVHPQLSDADHVGLSWYDPAFPVGEGIPTRFASVPISLG